ncbi:Protein ELF4-LIKE 1 [Linum grandiflorum]
MDDTLTTTTKSTKARSGITATNSAKSSRLKRNSIVGDLDSEECDKEAWDALSKRFRQAQSVLDQNRSLIEQVNENHQSKIPENLSRNVSLINEINGNISKVMSIYSDLSVNFANVVQDRRRSSGQGGGCGN